MIDGMTTKQFLHARMVDRTAKHLKIVIMVEGERCTLYPKDDATKQRWLAGYVRKSITVVEG